MRLAHLNAIHAICWSVTTSQDVLVFISPPGPSKLSSSPWAPVSNLGDECAWLRQPDLDVDPATWSPEGERRGSLPHGKRLSHLIHLLCSIQLLLWDIDTCKNSIIPPDCQAGTGIFLMHICQSGKERIRHWQSKPKLYIWIMNGLPNGFPRQNGQFWSLPCVI